MPRRPTGTVSLSCLVLAVTAGCGSEGPVAVREQIDLLCSLPLGDVYRGAPRGAIPALVDPPLARWGEPGTEYLRLEDRVVGLELEGEALAIPLNILWWHEIVNLDGTDESIAVTHCPLTGSSLAFDRDAVDAVTFDVSGLLYENNLMMVSEDGGEESFWPQMARTARCGPLDGRALPTIPVIEMTWAAWSALYPDSRIPTDDTGHFRDYTLYPYADLFDPAKDYDYIHNAYTLFPVGPGIDARRPPKERALGIPDGDGAVVFPYGELSELGFSGAVHGATEDGDYVVFWDLEAAGAAAYRPTVGGQTLTFRGAGSWVYDNETGSRWRLDGRAIQGPLEGSALDPISDAFVAFWFAWPAFYDPIDLWEAN